MPGFGFSEMSLIEKGLTRLDSGPIFRSELIPSHITQPEFHDQRQDVSAKQKVLVGLPARWVRFSGMAVCKAAT